MQPGAGPSITKDDTMSDIHDNQQPVNRLCKKSCKRVETFRIGMVAGDDPNRISQIQQMLRVQADEGLFTIIYMDDESALLAWSDHGVKSPLFGGVN